MCSGDDADALSNDRRNVLPSKATTPSQAPAKRCMKAMKHVRNCVGSISRNTRENVSCDGGPFSSVMNVRRNVSLLRANSAQIYMVSAQVSPPLSIANSAINSTS